MLNKLIVAGAMVATVFFGLSVGQHLRSWVQWTILVGGSIVTLVLWHYLL